jgi:hypothetical protein
MVFHDKYELLALRGGDKEIALLGREISSARPVLLHLLNGGYAAENEELLRVLGNLPADRRGHVLDSGDHDGIPYVVTDTLPGNLSLRSWVAAAVVAEPPQSIGSAAQAGTPNVEPGEFTRLFQPGEKPPQSAGAAAPLKPTPAPARPAAATQTLSAAPAEPEIGEFTRLLRMPAAEPKAAAPSVAPPPKPAAEPGEFTAMFQPQPRVAAAAATSAPVESTGLFQNDPAPPPAPRRSGPGEFTQAMQPPLAPESRYSKPAALTAAPPGKFTQFMRGSGLPKLRVTRQTPLPQDRPRESPPGEFTRIFETPAGNASAPAASQTPLPQGGVGTVAFSPPSALAGSAGPSGPGEFTKIFAKPSPPPMPAAPKPPQPAAGRIPAVVKKNQSYLSLILILAGLFLLAVIVIVVLVLMR